jgi:hypothetical protein
VRPSIDKILDQDDPNKTAFHFRKGRGGGGSGSKSGFNTLPKGKNAKYYLTVK